MRVEPWRRLSTEELMLLNFDVGEDSDSPLDSKDIKPVSPKGNQPWISLEELMLKLKLKYFGHLMWRAKSLKKTLMLGKIEGRRRKGRQRMNGWLASLTQWTWIWADSRRWWSLMCWSPWGPKESDVTEQLNNNRGFTICVWGWEQERLCPTVTKGPQN